MAETNHKDKPLTIGIFTDDFYPASGGVGRSIELQLHELVRLGHNVILFAPKKFFEAPNFCASEPLDVWHINGTQSFLCSLKFGQATAERLAKTYKFDVVHSQNERGAMFLAGRIARLLDIPHVHTFHSNYAGTHKTAPFMAALNSLTYMQLAPLVMRRIRPDRDRIKVRLPRKLPASERSKFAKLDWRSVASLAQYTDAYTSPAPYVVEAINNATRGQLEDKGFVVPNGIEHVYARAKRIRSDDGLVRFLSVCRLDPEKRVDVVIKAFAKLDKPDTELHIVGSGSEDGALRKLAKDLNPRGSIVFLGQYNDTERIANEYANADVYVFASYRFDTQGMVLAEAAAAGAPIIYCDSRLTVGVSPENAVLTGPSPSGIAEGMRALYNDPDRRAAMSASSRLIGKKLTPENMEKNFLRVYEKALTRHAQ